MKRTGLVSAIVALASVAACSNKQESKIDPSLKADLAAIGGTAGDLELAPNSSKSQVVVSAIEGGPTAAPTRAAAVKAPRPVQHKAPPAAAPQPRVSEPAPVAVAEAKPAPAAPAEQPAMQAPAPAPTPAPRQDHRVYKTEAEIFRQMPWIRP